MLPGCIDFIFYNYLYCFWLVFFLFKQSHKWIPFNYLLTVLAYICIFCTISPFMYLNHFLPTVLWPMDTYSCFSLSRKLFMRKDSMDPIPRYWVPSKPFIIMYVILFSSSLGVHPEGLRKIHDEQAVCRHRRCK